MAAPTVVFCTALAFRIGGVAARASVFEAAMAPMVTSAILASEYGLNPRLSNLMVSVGLLLSLITTGLWFLVLKSVS